MKSKPKHSLFLSVITVLIISFIISSCRSTKLVPEDKFLLTKSKIKCDNSNIKKDELMSYVKQKPNRKIFFFIKFHLGVYNISHTGKERKIKKWLGIYKMGDIIGEPPTIYDSILKDKSKKQITLYLQNKGYYHSIITDTVIFKKKKAEVYYNITLNKPYLIRNIKYNIKDTSILKLVLSDTTNSKVKQNALFDVDVLQEERNRITNHLKNNGYYNFSKEYIYYKVDSSLNSNQVDVTIDVKNYTEIISSGYSVEKNHETYKVNNIYIYTDYDPKVALQDSSEYLNKFDTLLYNGIYFLYNEKLKIKTDLLIRNTIIKNNSLYCQDDLDNAYKQLSSLKIYKFINISFEDIPKKNVTNDTNLLDCKIYLTPLLRQSYQIEIEGTNSSGNLGAALNYNYQHKNLLKGAEILDLKFNGAIEQQSTIIGDNTAQINQYAPFNTIEIGGESKINVPKLLIPFNFDRFIKKFNPRTAISLAYNYQNRPDFTRTVTNISFGYLWNSSNFIRQSISLIDVNYVKVPNISNNFDRVIRGTYLENSYKDHLIPVIGYNFNYNSQDLNRIRNFMLFGFNFESAGNILYTFNNVTNEPKVNESYEIFNTRYAQYIKGDFDYRYYFKLNSTDKIVFRTFLGIGFPYGNMNVMPFEKRYFVGGANSIRAWAVRTIGPGTYKDTISFYPNQTGDIKIEGNLEYRFKLIWKLEGAYFIDAGNVWAINKNDDRPGALFDVTKFYNEFAVGSGLGLRVDLSFFIFRLDVGVKILDPNVYGERLVIIKKFTKNSYAFNIGIGYPF